MWLFTVEGFLSVVEHRQDPNLLMVRARNRSALEPIARRFGAEIAVTPKADYPCRLVITRAQMSEHLKTAVQHIDYANFKNAAHVLGDRQYDRALMQVWSAMYESSPANARTVPEPEGL